jgi:hypothetical protein
MFFGKCLAGRALWVERAPLLSLLPLDPVKCSPITPSPHTHTNQHHPKTQFVVAELGTEGSIDGNNRLVLRGKYVPKGIESLLRKYIGEYVACTTCKSPNTALSRDSGKLNNVVVRCGGWAVVLFVGALVVGVVRCCCERAALTDRPTD